MCEGITAYAQVTEHKDMRRATTPDVSTYHWLKNEGITPTFWAEYMKIATSRDKYTFNHSFRMLRQMGMGESTARMVLLDIATQGVTSPFEGSRWMYSGTEVTYGALLIRDDLDPSTLARMMLQQWPERRKRLGRIFGYDIPLPYIGVTQMSFGTTEIQNLLALYGKHRTGMEKSIPPRGSYPNKLFSASDIPFPLAWGLNE
jgi:hypothetical protein